MSIYYSQFRLNTYRVTPYFEENIPRDYPLDLVLQKSRRFNSLPPHLKELSALAKKWAERTMPDSLMVTGIKDWYDDKGNELDPDTGKKLTTEEIEDSWGGYEAPDIKVKDIPVPKGGFPDPDTWEVPKRNDPNLDDEPPSYEQLLKDIASHGREETAAEYNIPISKLPNPGDRKLSINEGDLLIPRKVSVTRDWDALKSVMVGRGDNDVLPAWYPSFTDPDGNEVAGPDTAGQTKAKYDPEMYDRNKKQKEALCELLKKEGVQVFRPPVLSPEVAQEDPVGLTQAWAREFFTVIGNKLIVNQPRTPHRNKDKQALEQFYGSIEVAGLAKVHRLPTCSFERNDDWVNDPRPFLEGGDVFRMGKDVIVTMSYLASSPAGFRWLSDLMEPDGIEVWPAYLTERWEHGDYVFMPVREGLCVAYLQGFVDGLLPSPCTDWDCISLTMDEADKKFAANGLILRENVMLMPKGCPRVVRALEKKGVDVIEIPFDGPMYWQGGIDCSTTELWRGS